MCRVEHVVWPTCSCVLLKIILNEVRIIKLFKLYGKYFCDVFVTLLYGS